MIDRVSHDRSCDKSGHTARSTETDTIEASTCDSIFYSLQPRPGAPSSGVAASEANDSIVMFFLLIVRT